MAPGGRSILREAAFVRLWLGTTAPGLATWAFPFVLWLAVLDRELTATPLGLVLAGRPPLAPGGDQGAEHLADDGDGRRHREPGDEVRGRARRLDPVEQVVGDPLGVRGEALDLAGAERGHDEAPQPVVLRRVHRVRRRVHEPPG
jgi:hypothetical protein